uniref:TSEN54 tRNA splicing endonuclease subunit n=1 Tax=Myripristis murdjan TaxID=586833 RepID=A0A667XE39_9TELE
MAADMADQNKTAAEANVYSEVLSPSELFAARSRSHKIPVRGQKDFFPNESEQQRQRLEQSLTEHWSLISEERVERLGNLVRGLWIPSDQTVELQSPAGNLQVFHDDLPLSIQDGYERFLSSQTVTLQQYQVFGHLKRLGYVVNRFDPSSVQSAYERQLNLPPSRDRAGRQLKRKRTPSPGPSPASTSSKAEAREESASGRMEEDKLSLEGEEEADKADCPVDPPARPEASQAQMDTTDSAGGGPVRKWWTGDVPPEPGHEPDPLPTAASPRWDFCSISFPDLGSRESRHSSLASPDSSLLPGDLSVGVCDIAPWLGKLNLRKVHMSAREKDREHDRRRRQWDVNKDKQVRRCRNWAEYRELQARRRQRDRPPHLWESEVTPLHDPKQPISTKELQDKISVIKSSRLQDDASRLKSSDEWRICFNVYQPDTVADFKKSNPGKPYSRMCVCSFDGPVPDLHAVKLLASQSGDVPVVCAVVDHGDISFYTFKDFQLPTDVYD